MAEKKPHIVFITSRLDLPGGTERAVVQTANLLRQHDFPVTLVILDASDAVYFPLEPGITTELATLHFGITGKGNMLLRKLWFRQHVKALNAILEKCKADVVIGTEYPFSIAASMGKKKRGGKVFSWEHHHFHELEKNRFWNYLFRKYYPQLDGVICLNADEAALFEKTGVTTHVIPNFIELPKQQINKSNFLITVARLSKVKGMDRLMQVAEKVLAKNPDWKWKLIGEGDEEQRIKEWIVRQGLEDRFLLLPPQGPDLHALYDQSAVYVMTSRNECFPLVLLEAMSFGLPSVAFDCETGPRHIIRPGVDGLLVKDGDVEGMVEAINGLINDAGKWKEFSARSVERVGEFTGEVIFFLWEKVLL